MSNRDELANMKEEGLEVNSMEAKTMKDMQKEVDAYIGQFKEGYFSPLAMILFNGRNGRACKRGKSLLW